MAEYNLSTNQADRINLDTKAYTDGSEDARLHFGTPGVIKGIVLQEYAKEEAELWLGDHEEGELTDDVEEFIARYTDSYVKGYSEQIASMTKDREEQTS